MKMGHKTALLSVMVAAGTALVITGHPWWVLLALTGWIVVDNS